jgi:hypothetical protein
MCKCSEKVKEGLADKKALFVIVALLVKGTVADKANLYVLIGSDGLKKISSDQLHHMTCSLISAALHSRHLNPRAAIWGGEDSESNGRLARVFLDDASFQPQLSGTSFLVHVLPYKSVYQSAVINCVCKNTISHTMSLNSSQSCASCCHLRVFLLLSKYN